MMLSLALALGLCVCLKTKIGFLVLILALRNESSMIAVLIDQHLFLYCFPNFTVCLINNVLFSSLHDNRRHL